MSQKSKIKTALENGEKITPLDALNKFGCFRLGARIFELRQEGLNIVDVGKKNYAEYVLKAQGELKLK